MKRYIYKIMELKDDGRTVESRLTALNFRPGRFWILPSQPGTIRILYVDKEVPNDD